jgi:hypothetical protein
LKIAANGAAIKKTNINKARKVIPVEDCIGSFHSRQRCAEQGRAHRE